MSATELKSCTSCGVPLVGRGSAYFPCPQCGNTTVGRCARCRDQSVEYTCPACGFVGP
ncbi:MAG: zinc finger domain-containing protein [Candidatus Thermoplasmatota archaeon]|nr:zinc finger domain-containing protein [Candidatus Thermoplasmatota archaeon]MCL5984287.1 zinc finger domain-containing protein [Candidatus Thermoplasmatota archaeon]